MSETEFAELSESRLPDIDFISDADAERCWDWVEANKDHALSIYYLCAASAVAAAADLAAAFFDAHGGDVEAESFDDALYSKGLAFEWGWHNEAFQLRDHIGRLILMLAEQEARAK